MSKIVILGAGLTGLSAAYHLRKKSRKQKYAKIMK